MKQTIKTKDGWKFNSKRDKKKFKNLLIFIKVAGYEADFYTLCMLRSIAENFKLTQLPLKL